jgi:cell division protein FtsI (penicillin-binding protein 3)
MKQLPSLRSGPVARGGIGRGTLSQAGARSSGRGDRVAFNANPLLAVRLPAWRSKFLLFALFCGFVTLAGRAFYLQGGLNTDFLQRQGEARYARTLQVPANRGKVTDRNGVVLAASIPARAVWAIPDDVDAGSRQLAQLAQLLDMPLAELKQKLADPDRSFVYLRRQVEPAVAERIAQMKLAGIHSSGEFKRHYPESASVAHVIGFTSVEDRGQEGVELAQESLLEGRSGSRRVIKDRLGRVVEEDWQREPVPGRDLALSLDNRIQYVTFTALKQAVVQHNAKAGAALVIDTRSGEVLALANWPSFDPNLRGPERQQWPREALRNRVLTDTFEPGSTLKPFSVAAAIEAGRVTPSSRIQTAPGRMKVGGRTINDAHPHDLLTVEQVVAKSSNVGTVKIAMQLPPEQLWTTYTAAGFGQAPHVGFRGAVAGRLRAHRDWKPIEQATISYGYGVSVSLLQLARAYTAFARDGDVVPVTLLRADPAQPVSGVQVMSPETARAVRRMLELATSEEGTAPQARIAGYRVAGKTGTARKLRDGRYVNSYVASFAGFAPVSDPRIVVAVMIDEPGGGRYYGGDVAAPVFAQIAAGALRTLQVAPDQAPRPDGKAVLAAYVPGGEPQGRPTR